jgi:putative transposase
MKEHESKYPVTKMSKSLCVSKSGYYAWRNRPRSRRVNERQILVREIIGIQKRHRWQYGEKRITHELNKTWRSISRNRVIRILSEEGLGVHRKKRFITTTNSRHSGPFSPNLLDRKFSVSKPDFVWVTDITYCRSRDRFLYLCVFIDLYSRTVVGWALGETLETDLVNRAFSMALINRKPSSGLMIHSDRGIQYCSEAFRVRLSENHCIQSMSRKGNCWDNAVAESFFKTLKNEHLHKFTYNSFQHMKIGLFGYLDGYYNRVRAHSALSYMTPLEYESKGA